MPQEEGGIPLIYPPFVQQHAAGQKTDQPNPHRDAGVKHRAEEKVGFSQGRRPTGGAFDDIQHPENGEHCADDQESHAALTADGRDGKLPVQQIEADRPKKDQQQHDGRPSGFFSILHTRRHGVRLLSI